MQFKKKQNCLLFCRYAANTETNCSHVRRDLGNEPDNDPLLSGAAPETDELPFFLPFVFPFFGAGGFYCEKPEWRLLVLLQAPEASIWMIHAQQQRRYYNDLDIKMRPGIFVLKKKKIIIYIYKK